MHRRGILRWYVYLMFFVVLLPLLVVFPVSLSRTAYLTYPPQGLTLRWFSEAFRDPILIDSLKRSLVLALVSASSVVGTALLAAFAIARRQFRAKNLLETLFIGPRVVPLIILVVGLLILYHSVGIGESFLGVLLSHLVITIPFAFRTLMASIASLDPFLEWTAKTLGAGRIRIFLRVTLPQIKTGIIAAFLFTFISSFNNVTMALFLSPPGQRTLPVELFMRMQVSGMTPKVPALSFVLAFVSIALFVVLDKTLGIYKYLAGSSE